VTHEHEHLRYMPGGAEPAVFAARADVVFDPPSPADEVATAVSRFLAALSAGLAGAGCTLVGHIKGTLAAPSRGDLTFHATSLAASARLTGGLTGTATHAALTVNVIVFGVDEQALPGIVTGAWSRTAGAETAWRR
jgi:hypothetical protein